MQYNAGVHYPLCLASNWEYDEGFIRLLDSACRARGRRLLTVTPSNLAEVLPRLAAGEAGFSALLDRASEADPAFLPLVDIARAANARRFNPRELADQAYDKAVMHYKFIEAGIHTPPTIILPAYDFLPVLPDIDLAPLGEKFSIKPALGGGGEGVRNEATRFEEARRERMKFPEQQYLLQAHVAPKNLDGFPAWFRVIYCLGDVHPSYWDVTTHVYRPLPEECKIIPELRLTMTRIANVCKLDLFSSELALTQDNRLLAVDYVNDPIDLRLQSASLDGVPDAIVGAIADRLAGA
ncbi:MAG: hypothetical protein HFACDABA_00212 [Anaerolineales bacterium]|nr:hypothetical protein [Anaerolineales bacterium]